MTDYKKEISLMERTEEELEAIKPPLVLVDDLSIKYKQRLEELPIEPSSFTHQAADNLLCLLLIELGYSDVIEAYQAIGKWYD